jgi:hypothetical protein
MCTWRCVEHRQCDHGTQTCSSVVRDVAERLGIFRVDQVRFARGTARYRTWRELGRRLNQLHSSSCYRDRRICGVNQLRMRHIFAKCRSRCSLHFLRARLSRNTFLASVPPPSFLRYLRQSAIVFAALKDYRAGVVQLQNRRFPSFRCRLNWRLVPFVPVGGDRWLQCIEGTSLIQLLVFSIPTAPTNHPFSQQQLSDLSRRQKAAIRASRVAPMARGTVGIEHDVTFLNQSRDSTEPQPPTESKC